MMARLALRFFSTRGDRQIGYLRPREPAQSDQLDQPNAHQLFFSTRFFLPVPLLPRNPVKAVKAEKNPLKPAVSCDRPELGNGLLPVRMGEKSGRESRRSEA